MKSTRNATRVLIAAICVLFSLSACGSDTASPSGSRTTENGNSTDGTVAGKDNDRCSHGNKSAKVRFVNLYSNATYPESNIEIWQGRSRTGDCDQKLATVAFGTASEPIEVFGSDDAGNWVATAFVPGGTDEDRQIITQTQTWKGGEELTMFVTAQDPKSGNPASFGSDQAIFDAPEEMASVKAVSGKATLAVSASAIQFIATTESWRLGVPGKGCLAAINDSESTSERVGGTGLTSFAVDAAPLEVALYPGDPGTCEGTPDIGPVRVDAKPGSRTYIFAYGASPTALKLLVLPLPS